ncbi:MAG: GntR family transcriptional regulator [Niameybacter sp.]|uniref:GntR family transcriptional regulator n=1 Tax=Niameybacter sp. TaxID=2033640 RepID=UPI002FCC857D
MSSDGYLYVKIYNKLLEEINQNSYKPGDRLPTEKELSEKYNVSRITSQKAMNMLVEDGIVTRYPGIGSFVSGGTLEHVMEYDGVVVEKPIIGIVLEAIWTCFGIEVFDGAYEAAKELGYHLIIKKSYGEQEKEIEAINELIDMGAKGIIIMPVHGDYYNEEILKLVVEKFPITFIDRYLTGIHAPFVGTDNVKATSDCVTQFAERGHKNVALITTCDCQATTLDERKQGYIEGMVNNSMMINKKHIYDQVDCIVPHQTNKDAISMNLEDIKRFLHNNPEVTGVVATEYYIGNLVKMAAHQLGKRVPTDLEIVCFDAPREYLDQYEFTHIRQNEYQMGFESVSLLHKLIKGEQIQDKILLDTTLMLGYSTQR